MEIKGIKKQGIPESTSFIDYSLPVSSGKASLNPSGTSSKKEYLALKAIENSLTNAAGAEHPVTTAVSDDGGITQMFPSDDGGIIPPGTTAISDDGGVTQAFPSDDGGIKPPPGTTAISDDGGVIPGPDRTTAICDDGSITPKPINRTTAINEDGGTPLPIHHKRRKRHPQPPPEPINKTGIKTISPTLTNNLGSTMTVIPQSSGQPPLLIQGALEQ